MIVNTTCMQCGRLLEPSTLHQRAHPECATPANYLDQLTSAFLTAAMAGDHDQADTLAATLDQTAKATADHLGAAVAYARHSWPVFPCQPRGKTPATRNGFHDATTDVDRIQRWWERHPDHNIGVATGHAFDVIDIDYAGKGQQQDVLVSDALNWWLKTKEESDLEIDGLVTTPRGLHAYVQPTGARNSSKLFGVNGVDYRGIGGYVVVPPSVRDDGKYTWWVYPSPRIKHKVSAP